MDYYNIDITQKAFEGLTDDELLDMIKSKSNDATDYLVCRYKNLVRCKARPYFLIGAAHEDVVQEGMIGLYKAIRDYSDKTGTSFKTFAEICITRQILSAIKSANRKKHSPLNTYVSISGGQDDDRDMEQQLKNVFDNNPETIFVSRENMSDLVKQIEKSLSKMEKEVYAMYINGLSYTEISERMNKQPKAIDNAVQRIKRKLAAIIE